MRGETLARLEALGFSPTDAAVLADHFLAAEDHGRSGHGLVRQTAQNLTFARFGA